MIYSQKSSNGLANGRLDDQVIATMHQIAGKDYQTIVSSLSQYDFQGAMDGVKAHVKKENKSLSLEELAELSSALKAEYRIQKEKGDLTGFSSSAYRSTIATVNYYLTQKKKNLKSQKLAAAERAGKLSYQCNDQTVLAADFIRDETKEKVLSASFISSSLPQKKRRYYDDALDELLTLNRIREAPRREKIELDVFDLFVMRKPSPEEAGLSYHLRESLTPHRAENTVLAKDFIVNDLQELEQSVSEEFLVLKSAVVREEAVRNYNQKLQSALLPHWDVDPFFQ